MSSSDSVAPGTTPMDAPPDTAAGAAPAGLDIRGRVAIVTGGNRGIGLGIADALAAAGGEVCIWGRDPEANAAAVQRVARHGTRVTSRSCDVAVEEQVEAALAGTIEEHGRVDGCFANAGAMARPAPLIATSTQEWHRILRINLDGTFHTLRAVGGHLVEAGQGGSLVVSSSVVVKFANPDRAAYAATKSAQVSMVRTLAVELAQEGIRVNALLLGWFDTDMNDRLVHAEDEKVARAREVVLGRVPLGRFGSPADVGGLAVYLMSDASRYHTGDTITVDGGFGVR